MALVEQWTTVASAVELAPGTMLPVMAHGRRLLVARTDDGSVRAADEMCTHEEASLCLGALRGLRVKCPLHGSWFSLEDGAVHDEPATERLVIHDAREVDGEIHIRLRD
jgi:3-phenylpropionate/trans-cinnamate dioxygenase ferredoxin subunit